MDETTGEPGLQQTNYNQEVYKALSCKLLAIIEITGVKSGIENFAISTYTDIILGKKTKQLN